MLLIIDVLLKVFQRNRISRRDRERERGEIERERGFILGTVGLYIYGSWEVP